MPNYRVVYKFKKKVGDCFKFIQEETSIEAATAHDATKQIEATLPKSGQIVDVSRGWGVNDDAKGTIHIFGRNGRYRKRK